jgi:hypothetical protein
MSDNDDRIEQVRRQYAHLIPTEEERRLPYAEQERRAMVKLAETDDGMALLEFATHLRPGQIWYNKQWRWYTLDRVGGFSTILIPPGCLMRTQSGSSKLVDWDELQAMTLVRAQQPSEYTRETVRWRQVWLDQPVREDGAFWTVGNENRDVNGEVWMLNQCGKSRSVSYDAFGRMVLVYE